MFRFVAIIAFLSILTTSAPLKIHAQEADDDRRTAKLFLLKSSDAPLTADKLRLLLDLKDGDKRMDVLPDEVHHSLLIRAWPRDMEEVEKVIELLDRPVETRVVRDLDLVLQDDRESSAEARLQRQMLQALLDRKVSPQTRQRHRDHQRQGDRSRKGDRSRRAARGRLGEVTRGHGRDRERGKHRRHRVGKDSDRSRSRRGPRHARGHDERGRNRSTARRRSGSDSRRGEHPRFSQRGDTARRDKSRGAGRQRHDRQRHERQSDDSRSDDRRKVQRDNRPRGMMGGMMGGKITRKPSVHTGKDGGLEGRLAGLEQRLERLETYVREVDSHWDQRLKRIEDTLKKRR